MREKGGPSKKEAKKSSEIGEGELAQPGGQRTGCSVKQEIDGIEHRLAEL